MAKNNDKNDEYFELINIRTRVINNIRQIIKTEKEMSNNPSLNGMLNNLYKEKLSLYTIEELGLVNQEDIEIEVKKYLKEEIQKRIEMERASGL